MPLNGTAIYFDGSVGGSLTVPGYPDGLMGACTVLVCIDPKGLEGTSSTIISYNGQGGCIDISAGVPRSYFWSAGTQVPRVSTKGSISSVLGLRYGRPGSSEFNLIEDNVITQIATFASNPRVGSTFTLGLYANVPNISPWFNGRLYCVKIYGSFLTPYEIMYEAERMKARYI